LQIVAATLAAPLIPRVAKAKGPKLMNTIEAKAGSPKSYAYRAEAVQFTSGGEMIAGILFLPARPERAPGVVVLGPILFVKEQAPMAYAAQLARDGYAVLIFDPRFSGESGGMPRRLENPDAKIADTNAALDWLAARPEIDPGRLAGLGICQGASEMIAVAANPRIRTAALVSGQYLYRENLQHFFGGGGPTLDERVARGLTAKARYAANGTVDYTPIVSPDDKAAGLPWPPINDWYQPWTTAKWGTPSRWENRYATMSDATVWTFDVDSHAARLTVPTLLVHGEQSDGGVAAVRHVHDRIAAREKRLVIVDGVFHTRFYDDPIVVGPAAAEVSAWFGIHL
jgi:dienelactone hydrolase